MTGLLMLSMLLAADPAPSPPAVSPSPGWFVSGQQLDHYTVHREEQGSCSDGPAVQVRSTGPTGGFATMMQVVQPSEFLGKRLRFSATVRTEGVTGWSSLWMRVDGSDAQHPLAFDNMQDRALVGNMPCGRVSVVLDVDSDAKKLAMGVMLTGEGLVEISNVKFEGVDATVPVTALAHLENADSEDPALGRVADYWFSDRIIHTLHNAGYVLHRRSATEWSDATGDATASVSGDEVSVKLGASSGTFRVTTQGDVTTISGSWGLTQRYPVEFRVSHERVDVRLETPSLPGGYERHLTRDDSRQVQPHCAQFTQRAGTALSESDRLELCGEAVEPGAAPVQRTVAMLLNGFRRTP